jgi:hypothetical protein
LDFVRWDVRLNHQILKLMRNLVLLLICVLSFIDNADAQFNKQTVDLATCRPEYVRSIAKMEPAVTHLVLVGQGSDRQFNQIIKAFSKSTSLESIVSEGVSFEKISEEIQEMKNLKTLSFKGNYSMDYEAVLKVLEPINCLRSLEIEITNLEEIPEVLTELKQLDRLVLHEMLNEGEEKAAECIAMEMDMQNDGKFAKTVNAYVYLSAATWNRMQDVEEYGYLRKARSCDPIVKRYTHVDPPIPSQDIPSESKVVSADLGGVYSFGKNGSAVYVPENAFVDENGAAVTGEVVLTYREFLDPSDFVASGIPMSYEKDGTTFYYESSGMVDINATSEGKEVYLAEGKLIEVLMEERKKTGVVDLWNFDDSTGTWQDVGNSSIASNSDLANFQTVSQAVLQYYSMPMAPINRIDTTAFHNRFKSPRYYHSSAAVGRKVIDRGSGKRKKNSLKVKKRFGMRIRSVSRDKEGDIYFKFLGNRFLHPELRYLGNTHWLLEEDTMDKMSLRINFGRRHRYSDMRLEVRGGQSFLILKEDGILKELAVTPVKRISEKGSKPRYEKFVWSTHQYNKSLERRSKRFNKQTLRKYNRAEAKKRAAERRLKRVVTALMTNEEKAMSWADFEAYAKSQSNTVASVLRSSTMQRVLFVQRLGLVNLDDLKTIPTDQVEFDILVDNKPIQSREIYICNVDINAAVSCQIKPKSYTQRGRFFVSGSNSIMFITDDEKIGVVRAETIFRAMDSKRGTLQLNAEWIDESIPLAEIKL